MKAALNAANRKPEEGDDDYEDRKDNWEYSDNIEKIIAQLRLNTNLIFTNGSLTEVKEVLDRHVRPSAAKAGLIAPWDVTIPAGPTGLDPKQTGFFQTLQIKTQIKKAMIEIVTEKTVLIEGQKVGQTEALLLDKLKIYPFAYKMNATKILQDGAIVDAKVLNITDSDIISKFKMARDNMAALSLGAGFPTTCSVPHSMLNCFKNMVAVCAETGYDFPEAKKLLDAAKSAPTAGAASAGAAKAEAPKVEEKKEEVEDANMGNLFGGDDDEY
jgi:large subunit ribosomal protein LP0